MISEMSSMSGTCTQSLRRHGTTGRMILRNGDICACLDDVQGLGTFLELEIMAESEEARPAALERIEEILNSVGYTMDDTTRVSYLSQLQKQAGESQIVTSPVYNSDR